MINSNRHAQANGTSRHNANLALLVAMLLVVVALPTMAGVPFVRNFTRKAYGGGAQNWGVARDALGVVWIANRTGLVAGDSRQWSLSLLPNGTTVRALFPDLGAGRIYVGGSEEFGYFLNDGTGRELEYVSLLPTLTAHVNQIKEVWKAHPFGGNIVFQADFMFMIYDGETTRCVESNRKIIASEVIGDRLYYATENGEVRYLQAIAASQVQNQGTTTMAVTQNQGTTTMAVAQNQGMTTMAVAQNQGTTTMAVAQNQGTTTMAVAHAQNPTNGVNQEQSQSIINRRVLNAGLLDGKKIAGFAPHRSGGVLVATDQSGLYLLSDSGVEPLHYACDDYLRSNMVFCVASQNDIVVFGTIKGGAVIVDVVDGSFLTLDRNNGLQNNTVLNASFDHDGNIWLALDNGVDYVLYNSPVGNLLGAGLAFGAGYDALPHNGKYYLATNQGLYLYDPVATRNDVEPIVAGQIWGIDTIGADIFVSADAGLFVGRGTSFGKVADVPGAFCVRPLPGHDDLALVATYNRFRLLQRRNGLWQMRNVVEGFNDVTAKFEIDRQGNIWLSHWLRGLYRLHMAPQMQSFDSMGLFNSDNGLPQHKNASLNKINGDIVVATRAGFFDLGTGRPRPNALLDSLLGVGGSLFQSPTGDIWCLSERTISRLRRDNMGSFVTDSNSYRHLAANMVTGYENIIFDRQGRALLGVHDGFYTIDPYRGFARLSAQLLMKVMVSRTFDGVVRDSVINSNSASRPDSMVIVKYPVNRIVMEYVVPQFVSDDAVEYSIRLSGVDRDFSPWSTRTEKEYADIRPGDYTFDIRYRIAGEGIEHTASLALRVLSPWYATLWAKACYVVVIVMSLWFVMRWLRRYYRAGVSRVATRKDEEISRVRQESQQTQLEHDYEISRLKSEQLERDIAYKSNELTMTTINLVNKNQVLLDISSQLTKLLDDHQLSPMGRVDIKKIQQQIKDNITRDDDWASFARNFDSVHIDFLKRLREAYPTLTQGDLRICAFLKMNLTSKEIATLVNISPKSVEVSRYRLRQKLGLDRDTSLTNFLADF